MKIKNLIFSDGKILEYNKELNNVELIFLDYCNNKFKLKFIDVQSVSEKDAIGYDLSNTKLKKNKGSYTLDFYDDEGIVFSIIYKNVVISECD